MIEDERAPATRVPLHHVGADHAGTGHAVFAGPIRNGQDAGRVVDSAVRARVEAERIEQHLSPTITDPTALSRLADRIRQASGKGSARWRTG